MAKDKIRLSTVLPGQPKDLYAAWLDGKKHSAFTGAGATAQAKVGTRHSAWDGYIHGWTLALQPGKRIVQSWRTTEFAAEDPDSLLDVQFAKAKEGTKLTITHTEIPVGQGVKYEQGWHDHYFRLMEDYFLTKNKPAAKKGKRSAKKTSAKKK